MPSRMAFFRAFFSMDPAHAGMILIDVLTIGNTNHGPRACGDDPPSWPRVTSIYAWTPRMRG